MPPKELSDEGKKSRASSTSTSKAKASKKGKDTWKCTVCSEDFGKDNDKIVQCEYCNNYYCGGCLNLSEQDYSSFQNPSLHWFCPKCEAKVMKSLKNDQEIEARCSAFMKAMEGRMEKLENDIKEKASVTQVEGMIADAVSNLNTKKDVGDIEESINSKVSEIRDSAMREKNVIIHGLPASGASDSSIRKQYDSDCVKELFQLVEVDPGSIKNVVRLGKKRVDNVSTQAEGAVKPRPLKVILTDVDSKQSLLKSLSKLKNAPNDSIYRKVSIVHDMSLSEREKNRELVTEARSLNEQDKSGKVKHVVRGPPWERRIVRLRANKD